MYSICPPGFCECCLLRDFLSYRDILLSGGPEWTGTMDTPLLSTSHTTQAFQRSLPHLWHIFVTSLQHLCNIFVTSFQHLCHIFVTSLPHLCHIFATSLQHLCHIFAIYLQHWGNQRTKEAGNITGPIWKIFEKALLSFQTCGCGYRFNFLATRTRN